MAVGIIRLGHIQSELNIAHVLTKALGPHALHDLLKDVLFHSSSCWRKFESGPQLNQDLVWVHVWELVELTFLE